MSEPQWAPVADDDIIPMHEAGPAAGPAAAPVAAPVVAPGAHRAWTPDEQKQIVQWIGQTDDPVELNKKVTSLGGPGLANAQELIDYRKVSGKVPTVFGIPKGSDVKPDVVPEGMEEVPANAEIDYGTLSGLSPAQIRAKFESDPNVEGIRRSVEAGAGPLGMTPLEIHGFTAGLDTEVKAGLNAVGSFLQHPVDALRSRGATIADAYHEGRTDALARIDYLRTIHPKTATAEEIGGALSNPLGLEARTVKGVAAAGAAYGGISGFEDSNGSLGERTLKGIKGAEIGAVAAPAVGAVLRTPGAIFRGAKTIFGGSPDLARRIVTKAIKADGNTPATVGADMASAHANDVPYMIADSGDNARGLLAASAREPGPGRTMARDALEERQAGIAERVTNAIERDLGPVANPHEVADQLMTRASVTAKPHYDRFYSSAPMSSPAIDKLLERPLAQRALARAYRIAGEEGRDPEALGFKMGDDGNVVLNPVAGDAYGAQAAARAELDTAKAVHASALRQVYAGGGANVASTKARLEKAQAALNAADAGLAQTPREGAAATGRVYSPQTLDYIKRGMDDEVESLRNSTTGKLDLDTEGKAMNNTRKAFVGAVDKLYPDYAPARAAWGGPVSGIAAMNQGRKALSMTADDLEARMRDMTPFEKQMFGLGTRRAMAEVVDSKGDSADVVNALIGTGKKRAMLGRLFGDRQTFGRFADTLAQEREGFRTFKRGMLGSSTALNGKDDAALSFAEPLMDAVANGGVPIASMIRMLGRYGTGMLNSKTKQQVAALLSETDPARFKEMATAMTAEVNRRGLRSSRINRAALAMTRDALTAQSQPAQQPQ